MNELITFTNAEFGKLRTIETDKGIYFVGKDVADALGYSATRNAIATHVDKDDKLMHQISASGQKRDVILINESGLYALIFSSKLPKAKEFKHWVTSEVLPSIRKTGSYSMTLENQSDVKLVTITPEMAEIMLEKNIANRKVNQANVNRIAADMATGNYKLNGETIKISPNHEILDGQHRLLACVKSNMPFKTYIVYNVERWRRTVNMESATGGQLAHHLRRYSYAVGKVAVLEELMDKLFIEYDDHGRVKELPL